MDAHHHGTVPGVAAPELAHHDVVDLAPLGTPAERALVTPTSDNAHLAVGAVEGQRTTDNPIFDQLADDRKWFATLRAELAILSGFTLLRLADGSYLVTRWNASLHCPNLQAVQALLARVGGVR